VWNFWVLAWIKENYVVRESIGLKKLKVNQDFKVIKEKIVIFL